MTDPASSVLSPPVTGAPQRDDPAEQTATDLDAIYRAHAGFVWRVARRAGVPDAYLEDLVHDVFLVVRRRLAEVPTPPRTRAFLYGVTRGVVSNHRRRRKRRDKHHQAAPAPESIRDPEDAASRSQVLEFVETFLDTLEPRQREVFELVDIEGFTCPEVAELVGAPLNTIYSRLRLARKALTRAAAARGMEMPA